MPIGGYFEQGLLLELHHPLDHALPDEEDSHQLPPLAAQSLEVIGEDGQEEYDETTVSSQQRIIFDGAGVWQMLPAIIQGSAVIGIRISIIISARTGAPDFTFLHSLSVFGQK